MGETEDILSAEQVATQEIRPDYDAEYDFPPDEIGESDGEQPPGEPESAAHRTATTLEFTFNLLLVVHFSSLNIEYAQYIRL